MMFLILNVIFCGFLGASPALLFRNALFGCSREFIGLEGSLGTISTTLGDGLGSLSSTLDTVYKMQASSVFLDFNAAGT